MIRAVIDTNVLVSGMIAASGNEALLLLAIDHELVSPCFSAEILQEYEQVLRRPKFGFEALEVESLLNLIRRQGEFIHSAPIPPLSPDPGDDKFIACALAAKSEVPGHRKQTTLSGILAVWHETAQRGRVDSVHRSSSLR
ncbi:MAG: putative toxin-antitoxin system toxin component, PIN family [Acidobacteria bacterium]|nr:MAG: putative toxin-antitoxin system toxin component, PIN family [Acidobacteriota bacterium]